MSADQLAKASGVGETTVIRFARILGYNGYSDMKEEFQRALVNNMTSSRKVEEGLKAVTSESVLEELLKTHQMVFANMNILELTKTLKNAAKMIYEGNDVYIFGEVRQRYRLRSSHSGLTGSEKRRGFSTRPDVPFSSTL